MLRFGATSEVRGVQLNIGPRERVYHPCVAISHWLVAVAPDDPIMTLLAELEAAHGGDDGAEATEEGDTLVDQYEDALWDHPAGIDMWRLGGEIDAALRAGLDIAPREFLWTDGAREFEFGEMITYLEPDRVRTVVQSLADLTFEEIDHRITIENDPTVAREEFVSRTFEVLQLMRHAATEGLGLLMDFSG